MHDNSSHMIKSMLNDIEHKLSSTNPLNKEALTALAIFTLLIMLRTLMKLHLILKSLILKSTNQLIRLIIRQCIPQ